MEDILGNLPLEITNEIFSYLSAEELILACQVNDQWQYLIMSSEYLWRNICEQYDLKEYTPPSSSETPFHHVCPSAKKYLVYDKKLKSNWITANSHVLEGLYAPTTEDITIWKRTFVRTYLYGTNVDIFKVDWQCKVHKLQRINTRYKLDGSDQITLNDTWLAITRLNATSLYKIQPSGEYKLNWIIIWNEQHGTIKYLNVNEKTSDEAIDLLIESYHSYNWIMSCKCIINDYIWLITVGCIVIQLDEKTGKALIIQRLPTFTDEFCFDRISLATCVRSGVEDSCLKSGIALFYPNAQMKYFYELCSRLNIELIKCLQQNATTVAFIQNTTLSSVVLINRQNHSVFTIDDSKPAMLCLHPRKPLVFVIFMIHHERESNLESTSSNRDVCPWKMSCYSCLDGHTIWNIEKWFKEMPDLTTFRVIHNNFLLLSPLKSGSQKYTLYNCNSGKIISITEEESLPKRFTDVFKVCKFISRNIVVGVKCYF